jgi:uncharacterized protein YaiI (UPF0178 family)
MSIHIFVDADACPVKEEIYKVAYRKNVRVTLVANMYLRIPKHELIDQVVVEVGPDAADDYIAEQASKKSIVITADIPLADRCIRAGAIVIAPNGKPFTESSIGSAMATRALMQDLRAGGDIVGGPPPFQNSDRSRFLQALDRAIIQLSRT